MLCRLNLGMNNAGKRYIAMQPAVYESAYDKNKIGVLIEFSILPKGGTIELR